MIVEAINHKDNDGNTALHIASELAVVDVAEIFMRREAQLNSLDEQVSISCL
jgi:ankyrin repeat protein